MRKISNIAGATFGSFAAALGLLAIVICWGSIEVVTVKVSAADSGIDRKSATDARQEWLELQSALDKSTKEVATVHVRYSRWMKPLQQRIVKLSRTVKDNLDNVRTRPTEEIRTQIEELSSDVLVLVVTFSGPTQNPHERFDLPWLTKATAGVESIEDLRWKCHLLIYLAIAHDAARDGLQHRKALQRLVVVSEDESNADLRHQIALAESATRRGLKEESREALEKAQASLFKAKHPLSADAAFEAGRFMVKRHFSLQDSIEAWHDGIDEDFDRYAAAAGIYAAANGATLFDE